MGKVKQNQLETMRHSASHALAIAVSRLYPNVKLGIGPNIENGFYYDFEFKKPITDQNLVKISGLIDQIVKEKLPFEKQTLSASEAKRTFKNQPHKLELINDLEKEGIKKVSIYKTGEFVDLCRGPHLEDTSKIGPFKLLSVAGAYWKGNEKNAMLTRIYGTAFQTKEKLAEHLENLEEAKKRDHKKLGPQLGLFMFHETAPGMPYWLPKGVIILNELINFWRVEHQKRGYQEIRSPLINKKELYETSGHWEHYQEHMFLSQTDEDETYALKPMNCPNAMVVFARKTRSYRDLPLRLGDTDILHRYERSGTLNGLFRVREITQDDAHIFVTSNQIKDEYKKILEIAELFYSIFDIDYSLRLGTRPEKFMGEEKQWDKAEKQLEQILKESGRSYTVKPGDGAFYGPKIDILMSDSLGREWQMGTIQLDFQIPQRFNLKYVDNKGNLKTPAVIHRVIYGSLERFMGILIEHTSGAFPTWLAPVQAIVLPITNKQVKYAQDVVQALEKEGVRATFDERNETLQAKIRDAELERIPYMLVVGEKEVPLKEVSLRSRGEKNLGQLKIGEFLDQIKAEIDEKL